MFILLFCLFCLGGIFGGLFTILLLVFSLMIALVIVAVITLRFAAFVGLLQWLVVFGFSVWWHFVCLLCLFYV